MPTLTRAAGHRGQADIAIAEQDHPRVARGGRPGIGDVERQPDPIPEQWRPADAERSGDGRPDPVGTDDDAGLHGSLAVAVPGDDPAAFDAGDGGPEPDVRSRAPGEVEKRGVESGPVEADRRGGERAVIAVREPNLRSARGLEAHRRCRPNNAGQRLAVEPGRTQRIDRCRRAEDTAGPPAIGRRALQQDHRSSALGEVSREDGPGRTAADDRDVDGHARIAAIA